ncbi:MAG: right-handed parallel beta-helix repeat-containing protein [Planctomycetota bacterium]
MNAQQSLVSRCLVAALASLLVVSVAHTQDTVNLVSNGGFEELDDQGAPVGWERFKPHFAQIAKDAEAGQILRVTSTKNTGQPMVTQRFEVPEGLDRVWIVTRMRAVNVQAGEERYMSPRVQLAHYDASGEVLGYGRSPMVREDADWTDFGYWYDLKEGAVEMSVGAGFNSSTGMAEFDAISVWTGMPTQDQLDTAYPLAKPETREESNGADESSVADDAFKHENLVINGDFESVLADGTLDGWEKSDRHYAEVVTESNGNRFLRITSHKVGNQPFVTQRFRIPEEYLPETNSRVWVSVRMRGSDIQVGDKPFMNPRVQMSQFDENEEFIQNGWSPKLLADSDEWVLLEGWYSVRPSARYISMGAGFNNSTGVADFDDLRVTLAQPEEAIARAVAIPPAPVWDRGIQRTIHLDPSHPHATDAGTGEADAPFVTLTKAIEAADQSKLDNRGTRLIIAPGEFREPLNLKRLSKGTDTQAPLIIEAAEPGTVFILGSERWVDGWEPVAGKPGMYEHHWPHDWGLSGNPWDSWGNERGSFEVPVPDIAQRYEAIFVNDEPMRQYLDINEMTDASFYVDEEGDRLVADFPGDMTPEQAQPDVALKSRMFMINGRTNLTVRGLTLKHSASGLKRYNAVITDGIGITIEDFTATLNGGGGLGVNAVDHMVWRNVKLNKNGIGGGGFGTSRNVDIDGLEISFNNWRGGWGNWATWHPCGMKNMANDGVIMRNVIAQGNLSHGLWLDWQNENFVVDGLISFDNVGYGFYNEANPGPITLRNAVLVNNRDGIHYANTIEFTLEDSIIMNNRNGAISLRERIGRFSTSRFTDKKTMLTISDWKMRDNVIVQENGGFLVLTPGYPNHMEALDAEGNLWFTSAPEKAFQVSGLGYTFDDWQLLTGSALGDYFGHPKLEGDPMAGYTPAEESPLNVRESWPRVHVENPGMSALANRLQSRVESTWAERYALTEQTSPGDFETIDLGDAVNRPLRTKGGWIGMPITQADPGTVEFHGIPFDMLDEAQNGGHAGVMLKSQKFTDTNGEPLPESAKVAVGERAAALYVLHVAGYAADFDRAATYTLVYDDETEHSVGIDVLGGSIDNVEEESVGPIIAEAELQDWWPTNRQFSHDHSKRAMVTPAVDPMSAARFLYTTQLKNPHPEKRIKDLRFDAAGDTDATVMILAVTARR